MILALNYIKKEGDLLICVNWFFPQLDQFAESDDDDDDDDDKGSKKEPGKKPAPKPRKYVPPKIAPMHYGKYFNFIK